MPHKKPHAPTITWDKIVEFFRSIGVIAGVIVTIVAACNAVNPIFQLNSKPALVIADFGSQDCSAIPNTGGTMGAAYTPPDDQIKELYILEPSRGCIAKIEYKAKYFGSFWIKLPEIELTRYKSLSFDVKAEPQGIPERIKVELKNKNSSAPSVYYVNQINTSWQSKVLELTSFTPPLSATFQLSELVFTIEARGQDLTGVFYLDNIKLIEK